MSDPGFFTPRIVMQRCSASITTKTPAGTERPLDRLRRSPSSVAPAPAASSRGMSTTRATFDKPVICCDLFGMYATCALPTKGRRWCSQTEYSGMSRTMIISSKSAPSTTVTMLAASTSIPAKISLVHAGDPRGRLRADLARPGSSPIPSRTSRTPCSDRRVIEALAGHAPDASKPSAPRHQARVAVGVHGALMGCPTDTAEADGTPESNAARTITITTPMTTFARKTRRRNSSCVSSCRGSDATRRLAPSTGWPGRGPAHGGVAGRAGGDARGAWPGHCRAPEVVMSAGDRRVDQEVVGLR